MLKNLLSCSLLSYRFVTSFVTVFATVIAITKDLPDVEGDRKYNIDTLATRFGARTISFAGKSCNERCCLMCLPRCICILDPACGSIQIGFASQILDICLFCVQGSRLSTKCNLALLLYLPCQQDAALLRFVQHRQMGLFQYAGAGLLLANYVAAIILAIRMPGSFRAPVMIGGHAVLALALVLRTAKLESEKYTGPAIQAFYRFIWNLFYSEYLLLPFL